MEPRFDHASEEPKLYQAWEDSGCFTPERNIAMGLSSKESRTFSMVLPPPNVTGTLHLGHASMLAIEDILARYHRMRGDRTLWIPGTDHAAIATQEKVEKELQKETGQSRHDLGREVFLERVEKFAQESHDTIASQVRRMGASVDWTREAYTLDTKRNAAVVEMFTRMHRDGLIYRGSRIVNWDPKLQTTVSDEEVDWREEKAPLYYFQYGPFEIATARPETKFGDKYVVVHPDDPRYAQYQHGQTFDLEWINGPVTATLIKDDVIDMEFGTGAMTITPWHDATDFEIAERHHLDKEQVIDEFGKMLPIAGEFEGMKIAAAREAVVKRLRKKGLVTRTDEDYVHRTAINSRGGGKIEPQIKEQWFVAVHEPFKLMRSSIDGIPAGTETTLAALMKHVVESKLVTITPERFEKTYFHWINNLRDWCISRQIWYGHRIPAWYRGSETHVGSEPEGDGWIQDPDTLDTWFSSGMWTFSTLGWPEDTEDLRAYHPTSVLETGYDILFFWVARMILMSTYALGEVPFRNVYLHGLVLDAKGQKMSKSKNNGIDPVEMIEKYGADAVRMSLIAGVGPGGDMRISEDKIRGYRNFTTKLWNLGRFVHAAKPEGFESAEVSLTEADQATVAEAHQAQADVARHIERFELHLAAERAYQYAWHTFADKVVEEAKPRLRGEDAAEAAAAYAVLEEILETCMAMLHPFMPYVTEAVHQNVRDGGWLAVRRWDH